MVQRRIDILRWQDVGLVEVHTSTPLNARDPVESPVTVRVSVDDLTSANVVTRSTDKPARTPNIVAVHAGSLASVVPKVTTIQSAPRTGSRATLRVTPTTQASSTALSTPTPTTNPPVYASGAALSRSSVQSTTAVTNFLSTGVDTAVLQATASLSTSFWFRTPTMQLGTCLIGKGISTTGEAGWAIQTHSTLGTSGYWDVSTEVVGNNSMSALDATGRNIGGAYDNDEWYHYVYTLDFSSGAPPTITQYVNGGAGAGFIGSATNVLNNVGTFSATRNNNTQPFTIFGGAGEFASTVRSQTSNMVDFLFWADQVLTTSDVALLYNGGNPPNIATITSSLSASASVYYSLRNLTDGLIDQFGLAPTLINTGCVESNLFP